MALTELKGQQTGSQRVRIERGPVRVFAQALLDSDPVYDGDDVPVPPTFPFVMPFWGSLGQGGAAGLPIEKLRGPGRAILHGEQGFEFNRWPRVGDVLDGVTTVTDVYEKERSNGGKLEFYVTETQWSDAESGDPVCTAIFTLVINVRPPKDERVLLQREQSAAMDALHGLSLADVLREHARSWPTRTAAVDGDVRLTYRELDERTSRLAHTLAAMGVGPADRTLWLGQNSLRVLELLLAAAKLGASCCPANWRQTADELAFVIDDLSPAVTVWQDEEIGETVRAARHATGGPGRWIAHDGPEYESVLATGAPVDDFEARDPAETLLLAYTAAWSGTPSAAMLSHTALVTQSLVLSRAADIGPEYVYLNSGPLFHLATLMQTFATFVVGGTNVFTPRVDAEELCRLIEAERCTGAFLVGPTIKQILRVNADGRYDLSSLRAHAGKPEWTAMITVDRSPWARNPGGYGQTEVTGMLTFNTLGEPTLGTHGRAAPGVQVRIVDPDDRDVPDGETGEIVARGPTVMNGYWNRPEETARRLHGGWHHTNDLGRREADGSLTFIGPKTRLIKSAAENVYPAEVEGAIASHPAVAQCAVIGVPDRQWTQSVKAVVVLHDGATATPEEIIEHVRTRIASYKKPRTVEFATELPRVGFAVDYDALDARYGGGGYPGAGSGT